MRDIAIAHNASSFQDSKPVDSSDYGYLINPRDSRWEFGISTYQTPYQGFSVTHSIAAFQPSEVAGAGSGGIVYQPVIDITVPFLLPHVVITPKVRSTGLAIVQSLFPKSFQNFKGAVEVRLEGDFSDFITAHTLEGQDVTAFIYLAPDVMEETLMTAKTITVEWIGNHIYLYYTLPSIMLAPSGSNTALTKSIYENFLRTGLEIADRLGKNARPGRTLQTPIPTMRRHSTQDIGLALMRPILLLFFLPVVLTVFLAFAGLPSLFMFIVMSLVFIFIFTYIPMRIMVATVKNNRLSKRYEAQYGKYQKNIL